MPRSLRVVFAGTPEFAASALAAIDAAGFPVPLVLTQPDRPAGRGMKLAASPVKRYAETHGLPLAQPPSLRHGGKYPVEAAAALDLLHCAPHDVMVVAAYGLLLPQEVLGIPRHGCINIHASLLPRWRGAAPIHRALAAGDAETGITLMQMDAGLDTGPMLAMQRIPIGPADTAGTLHDQLAALGAQMIVDALAALERDGALPTAPQPADCATYAAKIDKDEARIDWRLPAPEIARQIRAFDPFPGATASLDGVPLKLWSPVGAYGRASDAAPGTIVAVESACVAVACGSGTLQVGCWQKPGGRRLPTREFVAGFPLHAGQRFALPDAS